MGVLKVFYTVELILMHEHVTLPLCLSVHESESDVLKRVQTAQRMLHIRCMIRLPPLPGASYTAPSF